MNYGFPYHFLSFNIITFNINDWLIQGSNIFKKEYKRVTWLFMFLRTPLLCLKQVLVPTKDVVSEGCQIPYSVIDVTCLFYTCFESHWTFTHLESTGILWSCVSWIQISDKIWGGHAYCAYLFCSCSWPIVPLDFTYKTQVKW